MQHALRAVTELELIIQFLPRKTDQESTSSADSDQLGVTSDIPSPGAEHEILASLARALPLVTHLGIWEGLPVMFQSIFSYFKNICSIEQIIAQARNHVRESRGWYLLENGGIPNLAGNVCFSHIIWNSLPFRLASLTCHSLPMVHRGELHKSLRSLHLSGKPSLLSKHASRLCILKVCALLADAPHLRFLSTALTKHNTFYGGMCQPNQLAGMQTLHTRVSEAGLVLGNARGGVPVVCKCASEILEWCISLRQLLNTLPSFPSFAVCKLSLGNGEPANGCLYHLPYVFPCLKTLILKGHWKVTELLFLSECTSLCSLELRWNPCITMDALYQLAVDMPWLNRLVLHCS